jgi:hypothetical protein
MIYTPLLSQRVHHFGENEDHFPFLAHTLITFDCLGMLMNWTTVGGYMPHVINLQFQKEFLILAVPGYMG